MRKIELLSPAGNADIAMEAIRHGADAVYIGPPSHGARKAASNSLEDIRRVVDYAHIFNSRVYVTVNTIIKEDELGAVEKMIRDLYETGVDALIVQDMGILRMDLPPIALHASTQCDIRTPEKARFLQETGFSQIVLARELSVGEIKAICDAVTIPVEVFVHGALCVSYSGRCSAGFLSAGRSGNRGECPQVCRQAFTLKDANGRVLAKDKYLLSLKDFRADNHLEELVDAGVSSFKIEGRLKDAAYVKNVTAFYSKRLDSIIRGKDIVRASRGEVSYNFTPDLSKSFNRGFTDYRLSGGSDRKGIASIHTPKSLGESIDDVHSLRPGDGISFFDSKGEYSGAQVNGVNPVRTGVSALNLFPNIRLPKGVEIYRTSSIEWKKLMDSKTASRTIPVDIVLDASGVTASIESEFTVRVGHSAQGETARKEMDYRNVFEKLGGTPFRLKRFENHVPNLFFPLSALTSLRRQLVDAILSQLRTMYRFDYRRKENSGFPYISHSLDYRDNVANHLAERFYRDHGVTEIRPALEVEKCPASGVTAMTSRHCILRTLGICLKTKPDIKLPLELTSGRIRYVPRFDCSSCEMHLLTPP